VTFDIDVDGILSVKARKRNWCRTISNYSSASNLNENEVDEMLAEAEKYASADKEKRETIDLKIKLKHYVSKQKKNFLSKKILMKKTTKYYKIN
jgi:molecular chaperone DnaK